MNSPPNTGQSPDFESWFRTSGRLLLEQARLYTSDVKLAEDIAQEAAIKVFKAWDDEIKRSKFLITGYVCTTVRNCYLDHIKARSRTNRGEVELDPDRHDRSGTSGDYDDMRGAVRSLDGDEHLMIVLKYYYGLTIRDAGRQLGLSYPQACRLHTKALAHLAGLLNEGEA